MKGSQMIKFIQRLLGIESGVKPSNVNAIDYQAGIDAYNAYGKSYNR